MIGLPQGIEDIATQFWEARMSAPTLPKESEKPTPAVVTRIHPEYLGEQCPRCEQFYAFPTSSNHSTKQCDFYCMYVVEKR